MFLLHILVPMRCGINLKSSIMMKMMIQQKDSKSDNPLSNSDCLEIVYKIKYEETLFSKLEESEEVGRINK